MIVAPWKFDVLKTIFEGKYAIFKNIKFSRGNYQTDSSESLTPYCLYCSPLNFLPCASSKIMLNYFQLFNMKAMKANVKLNLLNTISIAYFL